MKALRSLVKAALVGWFVIRVWGPEWPRRFEGPQDRPLYVPGRTVFVGRREFFVREVGPADAPSLVMVHGWNFDTDATFYELVPRLADRFRIVMIDLRNHGKSDRLRGSYDLDELADEVAGVLNVLDIAQATVLGYSMGGMIAQELARRHPGLVARLVLGATAAFPIHRNRWLTRLLFFVGRGIARMSIFEGAFVTHRVMLKRGWLDPRYARWMWDELMDRDPTLYYEAGAAIWRFDSRRWVGKLSQPVLLFVTTGDFIIDSEAQYELGRLLPDPTIVELRDAGHAGIVTQADDIAKAIERFALQ